MITIKVKKGWKKTERFFHRTLRKKYMEILEVYGQQGVEALRAATPVDSGETANSWGYEIERGEGITKLRFTNSNVKNGINIVILLVHGHATRNGGYVEGNDFVTPALRPIFEDMADAIWNDITEK